MTLSYDHLFADLGKIVETVDDFLEFADGAATIDLISMEKAINDVLIDESDLGDGETPLARYDVLSGVPEIFTSLKSQVIGWISTLVSKATQRITDYDLVLAELNMVKFSQTEVVLEELYRAMVDDSETVDRSTITLNPSGLISSVDGTGTGQGFNTALLDGVSSPSSGWPVFRQYASDLSNAAGAGRLPGEHADYTGTLSELGVVSETMTLTCVADSETSGTVEGSESFTWTGEEGSENYNWEAEGSDAGPQVTVANGSGLVTDGEFENFTANVPDSWTIDDGDAGPDAADHIKEGSAQHRGSKSIMFDGDGAEDPIQISQTIADLTPLKRYFVALWARKVGAPAAGTITVQFEGTGYTTGTTEKYTQAASGLTTSFVLKVFTIVMPANIPSDMKLVISIDTALTDATQVIFDGLVLAPVIYHGGVGVGIVAGDTAFLIGDRLTFTTASDDRVAAGGTFQRFFRKAYRIQLPSDTSPSIPDSLAE